MLFLQKVGCPAVCTMHHRFPQRFCKLKQLFHQTSEDFDLDKLAKLLYDMGATVEIRVVKEKEDVWD